MGGWIPGEWALPDGEARYRFAVRHQTTTDMTVDQIHKLGVKSVAEIEGQMLALAKAQGLSDLKSFNEHIRQDPALHAKSGQQLLDLYTHYRDQMYASCRNYSDGCRRTSWTWYRWNRTAAPIGAPADYSMGAGDGSRPGRINVNVMYSGKAAAAERGGDRVPRRRAGPSPTVFDCTGTDRPTSVPQVST